MSTNKATGHEDIELDKDLAKILQGLRDGTLDFENIDLPDNQEAAASPLEVTPLKYCFPEQFDTLAERALPCLWITEPIYEENIYKGRTYIDCYDPCEDEHGQDALFYGANFYNEAMGMNDPKLADVRQDLFAAAERLYLSASYKGNAIGDICLGYIYYYDRAQGCYWEEERLLLARGWELDETQYLKLKANISSVKARAFRAFRSASDAGLAEGTYKLGDCYKNGIGCETDPRLAYQCYERAMEQDDGNLPYLSGSIALRLGCCLEEGLGCNHDFAKAMTMYQAATNCLDIAVRRGDWFYKKALREAKNGYARCKQEIDLGA